MALSIGTRLGPYQIVAAIDAGGMGEVYRARDPRLDRDVAIKVLPTALSSDPDRLRRFEQEARAAAALNHPNILAVHDIGADADAPFIVSELLEGETLRARLNAGPVPLRKAIDYTLQVARGLAAAHDKGITHRDLKPENVFITKDDRVKILDFGLAKLAQAQPAPVAPSALLTSPAHTQAGAVLGTVGYMAPEQVRGLAVDHRSDLFALGCVLYELLSGRRAFHGVTAPETMTAILNDDPPDLSGSGRPIPPGLVRIVLRCLEKSPAARFQTASDLAFALQSLTDASRDTQSGVSSTPSRLRERLVWMSMLAALLAVAVMTMAWGFRPGPASLEWREEITTPPTTDPVSFALSPDGTQIVFVGTSDGRRRLFLRRFGVVATHLVPGTEGASLPFWSPDSKSIGFFAENRLKRIDVDGAGLLDLDVVGFHGGGSWNRDDEIVFSPNAPLPIFRIPAGGGRAVAVTRLEPTHAGHSSPHFLPDDRHFLYYVRGAPEVSGIYVGQLDDMASRPRLLAADSGAVYASGHLLFLRRGTLTAHAFDADRLELAGKPFPVAEQVAMGIVVSPALAVSATGLIAYRTGPSTDLRQFVWVDRAGTVMQTVGEAGGGHLGPSLAGDGLQLAFFKPGANVDVIVMDLERGVSQRFTTHPADDVWPVYAPDQSIVFSSTRNNGLDLFRKPTVGAGRDEPLLIDRTNQLTVANDVWGNLLLYTRFANGIQSLWARELDGDAEEFQVVQTDSDAGSGQFSPDGRWIAYASKESGGWEIYVQAFPGSGPKRIVSTGGGIMPRWNDNGEELFYIALDDHVTAVRIRLPAHGQAVGEIEIAAPEPLFPTRVGRALEQTDLNPQYVVASGGQRFLMNTLVEPANPSPIIVIRDWEPKR